MDKYVNDTLRGQGVDWRRTCAVKYVLNMTVDKQILYLNRLLKEFDPLTIHSAALSFELVVCQSEIQYCCGILLCE